MKKAKTINGVLLSELSNKKLREYSEIATDSILMCDVFFDESEKKEAESQKEKLFVLLKNLDAEIKKRKKTADKKLSKKEK